MGAVSSSYRSILQGMSQQPPAERTVGQCTEQVNMTSDPIKGLSKRPPFEYVNSLYTGTDNGAKFYSYFRDEVEKYVISIDKGTPDKLRVFDLNGVEKTVHTAANVAPYLNSGTADPRDAYSLVTIGDKTIIANNTVKVQMSTAKDNTSAAAKNGFVEIRGGGWAVSYEMFKDGVSKAKYTTQKGLDAGDDPATLAPAAIATALQSALGSGTVNANTILTGTTISSVDDSKNGDYINLLWKDVRSEGELPGNGYHNKVIEVKPLEDDDKGAYYVKFQVTSIDNPTDGQFGSGYWVETVALDSENTLNKATMPLVLVRLPNGDFSLNLGDGTYYDGSATITDDFIGLKWEDRLVGNEDTNPTPSFVDSYINFCGFYQGRLFFLAGENIIFSRGDEFWNFWYKSATVVNATDPVDYSADTGRVTSLKYAAPSDGDLIIIAEDVQLLIDGNKALTPETANITPITYFKLLTTCEPEQAGRYLMLPTPQGEYSGIREFTQDKITATRDAPPITSQVNEFIEGDVIDISVNIAKGIAVFTTNKYNNKIYVYESKYNSEQKIQSAWSYYQLPDDYIALWSVYDKTDLYVVCQNKASGKRELLAMDIKDSDEVGLDYNIYLDRRQTFTNITTSFVVDQWDTDFIAVQAVGCPFPGLLCEHTAVDNGNGTFTITSKFDMQGGTVIYGRKYEAKYIPTRPFVTDGNDVPIRSGYLRVNRFLVSFADTGYLSSSKYDDYLDTVTGIYSGKVVGEKTAKVGEVNVSNGIVKLPFLSDAGHSHLELKSDHYTPMRLVDIEWEGTFTLNKRRL